MSLKDGIFAYLNADAGLTALVADRIFPDSAPTSAALPYITFERTGSEHVRSFKSASGLAHARIAFDVWAATSVSRENVTEALREAVDSFQAGTWGSLSVRLSTLEDESDDFVQPSDASQEGVFRTRHIVRVTYNESIPTFP